MNDPFGGIKGKDINKTSGFLVDKEEAIKEVEISLDFLENKNVKKPTFLETLRNKKSNIKNNSNNVWEYIPNTNNEYVNIHLFWSKKIVRSKNGVPIRALRVALMGLKAFFNQINHINPNINHPDILECYKLSQLNYIDLPPIETIVVNKSDEILLDPFAGVKGIDIYKKYNDIKKEKDVALQEINYSLEFLEQLEIPKSRREKKFINKKPKFLDFTFPTSENYLNVHLWWCGKVLETRENIEIGRARLALASISKFIEDIDVESPNLENLKIKEMYDLVKTKHKPGRLKNSRIELKPIEEGGLSYWSHKTHRWITGHYNSRSKEFIPPKENL